MAQLFGFTIDSLSLSVPDGVTNIADIAACELRVSLSRADVQVDGASVAVDASLNASLGDALAATVVSGGSVVSVGGNSAPADDDAWRGKSVCLPAGTILRIVQRNEVLARAVIVHKQILIVSAPRAPEMVGVSFASPSAAARSALNCKAVNGWTSWQVMLSNDGGEPAFALMDALRSSPDVFPQFVG